MRVLGLQDISHDSSACLVEDGCVTAAVEEERFTRVKHADGFYYGGDPPTHAIEWCLRSRGLDLDDVDAVALGFDIGLAGWYRMTYDVFRYVNAIEPIATKVRDPDRQDTSSYVEGLVAGYPRRVRWLRAIAKRVGRIVHVPHHTAHAASAYYASGFDHAAVLVMDGAGERDSTSLFVGRGRELELMERLPISGSLGLLYDQVTQILGMGQFGEGKTMGLAPYGRYDSDLGPMTSYRRGRMVINNDRIRAARRLTRHEGKLTEEHKDLAATLQTDLEQAALALADHIYDRTGLRRLCLAGGVTLNCSMNGKLLASEHVREVFIQPAANDAGCSVGAALLVAAEEGERAWTMAHPYLGPGIDGDEAERVLREEGFDTERVEDPAAVAAELLADGKVIGWIQGALEFGPRALGNRSVLADPRDRAMHTRVNEVKRREQWRPLAPSILTEETGKWFDRNDPSPFMLLTYGVREERRDEVPAIVHVDGTARLQTVDRRTNPRYHALISAFAKETGIPLVLNTSFNDRGEPIVRTPREAVRTFRGSGMDVLVLDDLVVRQGASSGRA